MEKIRSLLRETKHKSIKIPILADIDLKSALHKAQMCWLLEKEFSGYHLAGYIRQHEPERLFAVVTRTEII